MKQDSIQLRLGIRWSVIGLAIMANACSANDDPALTQSLEQALAGDLIDADFSGSTDGFSYVDDGFGTSVPAASSGQSTGSALRVRLGAQPNSGANSGAWQRSFHAGGPVTLSFDYSIEMAHQFEDHECAEVRVSIDGETLGSHGQAYVARVCDDDTTGSFSVTTDLESGSHTLKVGGYLNENSFSDEIVDVDIDNLQVGAAEGCVTPADLEGIVLGYSQSPERGFLFNMISGEAETANLSVFGNLQSPTNLPSQAVIDLYLLEDFSASQLHNTESWRLVDSVSVPISSRSDFTFANVPLSDSTLPPGGLGRFRALVHWTDPCTGDHVEELLPFADESPSLGLDSDGVEMYTSLISDSDPTPSDRLVSKYLGQGALFQQFLPESSDPSAETEAYYNAVGVNPDGSGVAEGRTIRGALGNLEDFRAEYFPSGQLDEEIVASYYNKGDLGIGREMHCFFADPAQRACYVKNFAPCKPGKILANGRCEQPIFGDAAGSKALQRDSESVPFATVAMVEREAIDPSEPNSVFFAVYACTGSDCSDEANHTLFNGPVALDNHGVSQTFDGAPVRSNTFNPGNCLTCHGSGGRYEGGPAPATFGAYFLPFDQYAFEYIEGSGELSRRGLEDEFREMNYHVRESHLGGVGNAARMIDNWYDVDQDVNTPTNYADPNAHFNAARVPNDLGFEGSTINGATNNEASGEVYANVYARACRGCHISHPTSQFSTYAEWQSQSVSSAGRLELIFAYLCAGFMPMAERTQNLVWEDGVRERLIQATGWEQSICNP